MAAFTPPPPPPPPSPSPQPPPQQPPVPPRPPPRKPLSRRSFLPLLPLLPALPLLPLPTSAHATATSYDAYAQTYETLDGATVLTRVLGFETLRTTLLSHAHGAVAEFAIGTGLNLAHYPARITSLTGIDASSEMLSLAHRRTRSVRFPVTLTHASAYATSLATGAFDTVVDTFSLCVYDRPAAALREMRRLVKPGGTVLLLEHSVAPGVLGWYQDVTAAGVQRLSKGCAPNQRVREMVQRVGFRVLEETRILGGTVVALRLSC